MSVLIACTPIFCVNTSPVVARRSNPAEPGVALLGVMEVSCWVPELPQRFSGPGDGGPASRFLSGMRSGGWAAH